MKSSSSGRKTLKRPVGGQADGKTWENWSEVAIKKIRNSSEKVLGRSVGGGANQLLLNLGITLGEKREDRNIF